MAESYSVLMSVYFQENPSYLQKSIESILSQTLKPDELIIVEDGPLTIELKKVIKNFKESNRFIKSVTLETNLGLGLALNEGLKYCSNELVGRMDSDDICVSDRFEKQVEKFNENDELIILGMQIAEFYTTPDKIIGYRKVPTDYDEILTFAKKRSPFNHPTVMFRKSKILQLGGYKNIQRKEDLELFLNALYNNFYCENLPDVGLYFRSNEGNYLRRKNKVSCLNYIKIIYNFYRVNFCNLSDLMYVICSQVFFMLAPPKLMKFISDKYLRKGIMDE